jgi:dienelactone hydrolase
MGKGIKALFKCLVSTLFLLASSGCFECNDALASDMVPAQALVGKEFLEAVQHNRTEEALSYMDSSMQQALPESKLSGLWSMLEKRFGPVKSVLETRIELTKTVNQCRILRVTEFQHCTMDISLLINSNKKISSFLVLPHASFLDPPYANKSKFDEVALPVESGSLSLDGTLSLPRGKGPFEGVVLVHGSGPCDRDETVESIKVFRDLACGLASNGIAVLRYEKRTKQFPHSQISTVKDETIDDALAAVATLRARKDIDAARIILLGHSLGGYLIPRMADADSQIAAFIIMAGPTRKLEDSLFEQVRLLSHDQLQIASVKNRIDEIKKLRADNSAADTADILGTPRSWWFDLQNYDPVKSAIGITRPIFVIQGESDYQVTMADFKVWKAGLTGKPNVRLKSYPGLSHCFAPAGAKPVPADYATAANVSPIVITDLVEWIKTVN